MAKVQKIELARDNNVETVEIKTTCKDFGSGIILNPNGDFMGKCKTCAKKRGNVAEACSFISDPAGFETEKKNGRARPFGCAIEYWLIGESKETVVEKMISEYDMKESAAKRFANDIFSVGNAAVGRARKKGGLIERYLNWAVYGNGEEPTGCKATLGFCKQFAPAFKEMTI